MNRSDRLFPRLALAGVLACALAVGACGRKGPLDPPPGGAPDAAQTTSEQTASEPGGAPNLLQRPDQRPAQPAVQGRNRTIPLDALLN